MRAVFGHGRRPDHLLTGRGMAVVVMATSGPNVLVASSGRFSKVGPVLRGVRHGEGPSEVVVTGLRISHSVLMSVAHYFVRFVGVGNGPR